MVKYIPYKQLFIYYKSRKNEGVHMEINIGIIAIIVLAIAILAILASGYVKASPNKAYIISGIKREPKVLIGRAGIKIPFLEKKDELILKQISIDIKTNGYIPTKDFIGVDIDAVAKVRVLTQRDVTVNAKGEVVAGADANKRITTEMANAAMKNFLNMNEDQIRDALTDSLQGNMREIIGTQCLKELCNDRKTFGDEVQAKAQKDMNALGIWIESCNIQKIEDENNLITALGQDNMSQIQKDASVAKAQADRDVAIARAQAQKDANDAQVIAETEIAQKQTELAIKKAELKKESDIKKAEADAAYKIQEEEQRKTVEITTANANLARQEKELELKEREVSIKEKALEAEVKKTAEANKYAAQQKADAEQYERQKRAEAELFEIQRQAEAEKAKSEAERFAKEQAAEVFVELESDQQELLIRGFSNTELKEVLDELYLDDTVDIVEEMPANVVKRILKHSDPDMRKSINEILKYPEDSTGSIMTTEFVDLKETMTVEDALKRIRRTGPDKETINVCYVIDDWRHLIGVLSIRTLLLAEEDDIIGDLSLIHI